MGDGKSERCLTLVELELYTCWNQHPCLSAMNAVMAWSEISRALRSALWALRLSSISSGILVIILIVWVTCLQDSGTFLSIVAACVESVMTSPIFFS